MRRCQTWLAACGGFIFVIYYIAYMFFVHLSQFGFIAYENEEGKNLFFHMSEVEGEVELQASVELICFDSVYSLPQ